MFIRALVLTASLVLGFSQAKAQDQVQAPTAVTCPLGVKDTKLTIQRVMINFGKFTMKAEAIARDAAATDVEIAAAVNDLAMAAACAQAVVDGDSADADLMPGKASFLTGTERDEYIHHFKLMMAEFKKCLDNFGAALTAHDFTEAKAQAKELNDLADEAHSRF